MKISPSEKSRTLFILNPKAGIPPVNTIIFQDINRRKNLTCLKSLNVSDSERLIKQNLENYDIFVAAGGDGTVHTIATELIGTKKILAVLPVGSGNGFAKEFGFRPNVRSLLNDIGKGDYVEIDAIEINDKLCLNVAGIGLDSFVAHSFNKLRLRGFIPYVALTLRTFLFLRPFPVTILSGGREIVSENLFVLTIANTRQFGNNAFIAPDALPDDGIIDIVLIRPFPKFMFMVFIYRLFTGRLRDSKYVRHIHTDKEVIIRTDETRFHIDGEPLKISGEVVVRIKRHALRVLKTAGNKRSQSNGSGTVTEADKGETAQL